MTLSFSSLQSSGSENENANKMSSRIYCDTFYVMLKKCYKISQPPLGITADAEDATIAWKIALQG